MDLIFLILINMHISWLGQTCVRLQTKNVDEDITVIIDGYKPSTGEFPRSFSPQIALYSHGEENITTLSQEPFIISTSGECEIKGVMCYSYPCEDGQIFKINAENINLVHLGKITKKLDAEHIEKLGTPDILFIPVGGGPNYLSLNDAADMITTLGPRIVIPIAYQSDSEPKAGALSDFIKVVGLSPEVTDKKFIIKKKDLPSSETKLMVLEKNY